MNVPAQLWRFDPRFDPNPERLVNFETRQKVRVILAGFASVGAIVLAMWKGLAILYIGGIVVLGAVLAWVAWRLLRRVGSRIGVLSAIAVLAVAAIVVPWNSATAQQDADPIWSSPARVLDMLPLGEDILMSSEDGLHAIDLETGTELWSYSIPLDRFGQFHATQDGQVLIEGPEQVTQLDADGEELWTLPEQTGTREGSFEPVAADGDVIVLRSCDEDESDRCTYRGIDGSGETVYEHTADRGPAPRFAYDEAVDPNEVVHPLDGYGQPRVLPSVFLMGAGEKVRIAPAATGEAGPARHVSGDVAVSGEIAVLSSGDLDGDTCEMTAVQAGQTVLWQEDLPCPYEGLVLDDRLYDRLPATDEDVLHGTLTVDMATGDWREFGPAKAWNEGSDPVTASLGADIVIERSRQHLTAVAPDTGEELWELRTPGSAIPGVYPSHGGLVVLAGYDPGWNPFADPDRELSTTVLVVDPDTGDVVTSTALPGSPWTTQAVGPERALMVTGGELMLIGR